MSILYASGSTWNLASNWGTTPGASDGSIPTSLDDAVFDDSSVSMAIDVNAVCKSVDSTGYTATLTQNTTRTLVVSGNVTWAAGTFAGGDSAIQANAVTISGGVFTSTSAVATWLSLTISGGTWAHGSGTVKISGTAIDIGTNSLYKLTIDASGATVTITSTCLVTNTTTITACNVIDGGTLEMRGDVTIATDATGTCIMLLSGSAAQNLSLAGGGSGTMATGGNWTIDKTNSTDTVSLANDWDLANNNQTLTITKGTLNIATYNQEVDSTYSVAANGTLKLAGSNTTVSTPTFASGGTAVYTATTGTITCKDWSYKNLTINGSGGTFKFGENHTEIETFTVTIGTFDQSAGDYAITCTGFTQTGGTFTGGTAEIIINGVWALSTGTFTSTSGTLSVAGNFTRTSGTFTHNSGTVNFIGSVTTVLTCTQNFYTITINKDSGSNFVTLAAALTAANTITSTTGHMVLAGFNLASTGAFTVEGQLTLTGSEASVTTPVLGSESTVYYVGDNTGSTITLKNWTYDNLWIKDMNGTPNTYKFGEAHTEIDGLLLDGGTLSQAAGDFAISCSAFVQTGGTFTGGSATITITSVGLTISGGTFTSTSGTLNNAGRVLLTSGTFAHNSGTMNFTSSNNWDITCTQNFYTITVNKTTESNTVTLAANLTAANTITVTTGTLVLAGYDLACTNAFTITSGSTLNLKGTESSVKTPTLDSNSTVVYAGDNVANTKTCFNWSYKNLTIADVNTNKSTFKFGEAHTEISTFTVSAGTFDQSAGDYAITCTGFTITNTGTFTGGSAAITVNGTWSVTSGTFTSTSGIMTVSGDFSLTGTFTHNSGTVNFTGSSTWVSCSSTFYTITVNKTSATDVLTLNDNLTISNTITVTASTLDLSGQNLACTNAFTVDATSFLKVMGTEVSVKTPTLATGSTVVYYGDNVASTKTCKNWTYKNLTFNDWHGNKSTFKFGETHTGITTFTMTAGIFSQSAGDYAITCTGFTQTGGTFTGGTAALTVNGAWALSTGTFTSTSGTLTVTGNFTRTSGTFTHNSGTLSITGGNTTLTCTDTLATVTINKTGGGDTFVLGAALTCGVLTLTQGTFEQSTGDYAITCTGFTLGTATANFTGGTAAINVNGAFLLTNGVYLSTSGTMTVTGNFTRTAGTFTNNNGTVNFTDGDTTVTCTSSFRTVTVNKTATANKLTLGANLTATNTITVTASTIDLAGYDLTSSSSFSVSATSTLRLKGTEATVKIPTFSAGATTVYYGDNVASTKTCKNWSYKNLTFNDVNVNASTFKFSETHTGISTFTVTAGTFSQAAGDYIITCTGMTVDGGTFIGGTTAINLSGDFTQSSGTFASTSGTMTFSGSNFTVSGGTFTQTAGTIAFTGVSNKAISVGSSSFFNVEFFIYNYIATITGTMDVNGDFTTNASGVGSFTGGTITIAGNIVLNDTAVSGTTAVTWDGSGSKTLTATGGGELPDGTFTINGTGKLTLASNFDLDATGQDLVVTAGTLCLSGFNLTINDQFTVAAAGIICLQGVETINKTPTLATGSTVVYNGDNVANTKTCQNWTYKNLTINDDKTNKSTFKFGETHTGITAFTITAGTFDHANGDYAISCTGMTVNGGTFIGGTTTVTIAGAFALSSGTVTLGAQIMLMTWHGGTWTYTSGTFTAGASTLQIGAGSLSATTVDSGASIFNNVVVNNTSSLTITGTMDVNGNLTLTAAGSILGGTIAVAGNVTTSASIMSGTGIILFDGGGAQVLGASGGTGYVPRVTINKSGGTLTIQDTIIVRPTHGEVAWTYTAGTVDAGTSTVRFGVGGTYSYTINSGAMSFNHVIFQTEGTYTITGTMDVNGDFTVTGIGSITGGAITIAGNIVLNDPVVGGTTAVTWDGAGSKTLTATGGTGELPDGTFTINGTGTLTLTTDFNLDATGQDLICTAGTLDLAGFNLAVNDQFTCASGFTLRLKGTESSVKTPTLASGSIVEYYGDNVANTKTCKNWTYKNITFNDVNANLTTFVFGETHTGIEQFAVTAGTFSQAGGDYAITCSIFNLTGGTFTGGTAALTCSGNYTVATGIFTSTSGTLTITGHFSHASGTWNHNNGTVTLTGAGQSITGSTVFYTLTKNTAADTLSFSAGSTFTFANNLSLQGAAGSKLNIRSLTPGTAYMIAFPATRTLKNLDWLDVENTVAANPVSVQECSRSGKTYGLIFPNAG